MEIKPDKDLDCRGLKCPMPVLRTKKAMEELQAGQVLRMVATDKGSKPDMQAFSERTGHELLGMEEKEGLYIYYIRKRDRR
jgi:TusA-related sulfurtransferase